MANEIFLERPQIELLGRMVEATRRLPETARRSFQFAELGDSRAVLDHPGFQQEIVAFGDILALQHEDLLLQRYKRPGIGTLDVSPNGIRLYEQWRRDIGKPIAQLEQQVLSYVSDDAFRTKYPKAHEKWSVAAELLWKSDTTAQLSVIGHLVREAMQEFAAELSVHDHGNSTTDKTQTVARVRSALRSINSTSERAMLEALLAYWGTVSDLVQRQEHAGQREGAPLTWEDARRVVFHTAVVMFEVGFSVQRAGAAA
jgi:hypothetical protein